MASVLLRQTLWTRVSTALSRLSAASSQAMSVPGVSTSAPASASASWVERIAGRAGEIWESMLLAVPKKKTSRTQKLKRMTGKHLRKTQMMVRCEICQSWKRTHFYCAPKCPGRREMGV